MATVYKASPARQLKPNEKSPGGLSLAAAPHKSANAHRSFDPYNTSGTFDRKKNWARVGKR